MRNEKMKLIDIDKRQRIDVESPRPERKGLRLSRWN